MTLSSLADNMRLDEQVRDRMKDMAVEMAQDSYNEDSYVANMSSPPRWSSHIVQRPSPFERSAPHGGSGEDDARGADLKTQHFCRMG